MPQTQPRKKPISPETRHRARELRREASLAEQRLWTLLRNGALINVKFRRQFPIGPLIADFCSPEQMLVVEVDGQTHAGREAEDASREAVIAERGYSVVRFTNEEVLTNPSGVLEVIVCAITRTPHPNPLPRGERGSVCEPGGRRTI